MLCVVLIQDNCFLFYSVLLLKSEFISDSVEGHGDTWTTRISAESKNKLHPSLLSLIIYVYNEGNGAMGFHGNKDKGIIEEIYGYTSEVTTVGLCVLY